MVKKILQKDEKVLRRIAKEIPIADIKTPKINNKLKKILKEMSLTLSSQNDGVAIAAPQIGYSVRIFVVSGKIFQKGFMEDRKDRLLGKKAVDDIMKTKENIKDIVFINPKVSKLSREKEWLPEGCLSVRPLYGKTFRSKKATITAYDENGKKFTRGASGLLAQIFQHETDHLNGILFIDHAKDIKAEDIHNK
jgi:peptide deformylase